MSDVPGIGVVIPPSALEIEHDLDPADMADTYAELEEPEPGGVWCGAHRMYDCECRRDYVEPFSAREYRAMAARYDGSPERVVRRR